MPMLDELKNELEKEKNPKQAKNLQRFFKTGKGEYGEGDIFLGLKVPVIRRIAGRYYDLNLKDLQELLKSKIHEQRLIGLFILVHQFEKNPDKRKEIFDFYLKNAGNINNWDLVDLSAPNIVGRFLADKKKDILYELAHSDNLWKKRIAILSTFTFIKNKEFGDSLKIAKLLLKDRQDLIHKAVGWMLREIGKKDKSVLEKFLKGNYKTMPRTMLRYAIEKFPEAERKKYLKGEI